MYAPGPQPVEDGPEHRQGGRPAHREPRSGPGSGSGEDPGASPAEPRGRVRPESALEALREHLLHAGLALPTAPLFTRPDGSRIEVQHLRRAWRRARTEVARGRLRLGRCRRGQRRRTRLQHAQKVARPGHPLRQVRQHIAVIVFLGVEADRSATAGASRLLPPRPPGPQPVDRAFHQRPIPRDRGGPIAPFSGSRTGSTCAHISSVNT